jgi:hypothetical protein
VNSILQLMTPLSRHIFCLCLARNSLVKALTCIAGRA